MSLLAHANFELRHMLLGGEMDREMAMNVLQLIKVFSEQGHSGFSASYCISLVTKLMKYEPITDLTGEDDEWVEVGPDLFQNRRMGGVFKQNGQAYFIDGKIWRTRSGACYTNFQSRVPVVFPCIPKSEYVDVEED